MEYSLDEIDKAAAYVLAGKKTDTLLFQAAMGTGKTTLIAAICRQLGVKDPISSPTFSIVNEYQGLYTKIYHFDLYRIESIDELYDIGAEEYFYSTAIKLIEWPEKAIPIVNEFDVVKMSILSDHKRAIQLNDK